MNPILRTAPAIALAALLLAASAAGGAVAGSMITGKQIKDNTVTTKDIKNDSLKYADLAPGTRAKLTAGVSDLELVETTVSIASGAQGYAELDCDPGKRIISISADWSLTYLPTSTRLASETKGVAYGINTSAFNDSLRLVLQCGKVS